MMYQDVIADFAQRTWENLRAIEVMKEQGFEVFETTQLINSMLGLLVFPREEFMGRIPETPLSQLKEEGWPVPKTREGFEPAPNLKELVRYLRNAISHYNIKFIGDGCNEVRTIQVWNNRPLSNKKTWEAELGINELRGIAERFTALLLKDSNK